MMSFLKKTICVFLFCCFSPVYADVERHSLELTTFYAFYYFHENQNLKNTNSYGLRLSFHPIPSLGIEASYEMMKTVIRDEDIINPKEGEFTLALAPNRIDVKQYYLDLVYNILPEKSLVPLIFLGAGAASYDPKVGTQDLLLLNVGLGFKLYINDFVSFRLDARDVYVSQMLDKGFHNFNVSLGVQVKIKAPKAHENVETVVRKVEVEHVADQDSCVIDSYVFHFDMDGAVLSRSSKKRLKEIIKYLSWKKDLFVKISGFASASGNAHYNRILSKKRANVIRDYLIKVGHVRRSRMYVKGYGSQNVPVKEMNPEDAYSPEALSNMRVMLEIYKSPYKKLR